MASPGKYGDLVITPDPPTGSVSKNAAFQQALAKLPAWKKYATVVLQAAERYSIDPVVMLAFFATENASANPSASSSVGAKGLAQIYDKRASAENAAGEPFPKIKVNGKLVDPNNLTDEAKSNPVFAINYLAWRVGGVLQTNGGDVRAAYSQYNPGYYEQGNKNGPDAFLDGIPGYTSSTPLSPEQKAEKDLTEARAKLALKDPYVTTSGKLVYAATPPDDAIRSTSGDGMRYSEFQTYKQRYADTYFSYLGREPTDAEIADAASNGLSIGGIQKKLAQQPEFTQGPLYQERAGNYVAWYKEMYGEKARPDTKLLADAVAKGLTQTAFQQGLKSRPDYNTSAAYQKDAAAYTGIARSIYGPRYTPPRKVIADAVSQGLTQDQFKDVLRQSPDYENSNEFKQMYSGLYGTFSQIYGRPDDQGKLVVKEAAKNGWDAETFGQYLRSQDAYTQSPEYQTKALAFLDAMGLVTGGTPVLREQVAPKNPEKPQAGPNDPSVGPPAPGVKRKPGKSLVAGFASDRSGVKLYG